MSGASEYGKGDKTRVSNYRGYWNNWDNIKKLVKHNTYKFRSDNIILVGDTHSTTVARDIINLLPDGSDVLHIGDVGLGFGDESFALKDAETWLGMFNDLCVKLNINLYLTRGNHDRPEVWKFPNLSNVFLLQDGDIGIFPNGKKALLVGGGVSVDRFKRTEGKTYWKNEITSTLDTVEKCDIVFSHDCPEHFNHATASLPDHYGWYVERDVTLLEDCVKQRSNMTDIVKRCGATIILYGHFHRSIREESGGVYAQCIDINERFFFDANKSYHI